MAFPLRQFQLNGVAFTQGHKRKYRYNKARFDRARLVAVSAAALGGGWIGEGLRTPLITLECGVVAMHGQFYAKPRA